MINKKNKTEFIKYLINEYPPSNAFLKDLKYKDIDNNYFFNLLSSDDIKTFLIIYSDEVLNTFNTADKNYLWDNLSRKFASKIREEATSLLKNLINRESGKIGSMKSFGLLDPLSASQKEIEEFKDGIYGVSYKIIYEKLEKILERDVYPAMSEEIKDV